MCRGDAKFMKEVEKFSCQLLLVQLLTVREELRKGSGSFEGGTVLRGKKLCIYEERKGKFWWGN